MVKRRIQRIPDSVKIPDEGVVILPFAVQFVSGAPVIVEGDTLANAADTGPGKFTLTFRDRPAVCFFADAQVSVTGDATDLYAQVDWTDMVANGKVVVKTKTGSANTDPPANTFIGGFVLVKKTTRRARGRR